MQKVCVIGDAFIDIVIPIKNIENITQSGVSSGNISFSYGGTANIAYWIKKNGAPSKFFGKVGNDDLGKLFKEDLKRNQIEDLVFFDENHSTGICLSLISKNGDRSMIVNRGANDYITKDLIKNIYKEIIDDAEILFFTGYSLISPITSQTIYYLMEEGYRSGKRIWYNPGAWNIINDNIIKKIKPFVEGIILNEDEAKVITKSKSENIRQVAKNLSNIFKNIIITQGKNGCIVLLENTNDIIHVPSEKVNKIIDTTGAGDAFAGGFIAGIMKNVSIIDACKLGHKSAAKVIQKFGTR